MIFYITERAIKNGQFRYIYKKTLLEKTEESRIDKPET
jgi:hypothetical protein